MIRSRFKAMSSYSMTMYQKGSGSSRFVLPWTRSVMTRPRLKAMRSMKKFQKGSGQAVLSFHGRVQSRSALVSRRHAVCDFVTTKSAMPTSATCDVSCLSVSLDVAPCEPLSASVHNEAVPAALAHTQSTAALATAPLVSVDLPTATAPCALDSALHFVPPRLVTVGAVASDVTLCILLALRLILLLARHHHTLPLVMLCATPFATTATGLTATGPTPRLLLPATSPTTPASAVSTPCSSVRTPAPRHEVQ